MSYILDALKRADAERSNTQPAGQGQEASAGRLSSAIVSRRAANRPALAVAGALLLTAALATWWVLRPAEPASGTRPPVGVTAPPGAPAAMATEARPTAQMTPPGSGAALPAASSSPQTPAKATPMMGPPLPSARVLAPTSPPFEGPAPVRPRPVPTPDTQAASNTTGTAPEPTITMAPGAAPAPSIPAAAALPQAVPAPSPSLPTPAPLASATPTVAPQSADGSIKVSGASYSANPAHRLLIVNGNLVKEGQEVEPGVTLEVISPHSAVFNRRGTRFNINY